MDQESASTGRRSRWGMKGLNFPSFSSRSRSTDSKESDERKEKREAARKRMQNKMSFWKRKSANITEYDPTYRVIYLGNVLTGWAKGDGCVDKPLSTLWRNHISSDKPDIIMKLTVVNSGLRAVTKEHGLTEYWANRITYSVAHPSYPRVFCWIYRHEGRKMKQELRCHAVLCPREDKAKEMAANLQNRLHQALVDFKKEKISRQNARLSLANSIHENPSMPYRKLLLQAGTCNYKPPIERSKSAPKLTSIEEAEFEDEEDDYEDTEEDHHHHHGVAGELHTAVDIHTEGVKFRLQAADETGPSLAGGGGGISRGDVERLSSGGSSTSSSGRRRRRVPPIIGATAAGDGVSGNVASLYLTEESDEDEITDYLGEVGAEEREGEDSGEADSAQSSSPASQGRSTTAGSMPESRSTPTDDSLSDTSSDPGGADDAVAAGLIVGQGGIGGGKIKVSEQDTISDESGYSEEPISGRDVTVVRVGAEAGDERSTSTATVLTHNNNNNNISSIGALAVNNEHKLNINLNQGEHFEAGITILSSSDKSNSIPVVGAPANHRRNSVDSFLSNNTGTRDISKLGGVVNGGGGGESESLPLLPSAVSNEAASSDENTAAAVRSHPSPAVKSTTSPPSTNTSPSQRLTDLSVKSVLLSEFSASDRIKYIERSNILPGKSPLVLNRQEFCINI